MMADDFLPFDHEYSSPSSPPSAPYFDILSDYMILLDDQYPSAAPAVLPPISTGFIPSSSWQPPQAGRVVSPPLQVADFGGSTSYSTVAAAAAAGGGGQFHMNCSQLASGSSSSRISNSGEAGEGGLIRVAFRTKTEVDVLDDGFKWRKYGKKSVKNSPNPRNYYRCSTEGCSVKKRVERDRDDPSYVITTYDGVHNHTSADVVYYATQDAASGKFVLSGHYGDTTTTPPNSST
uniref:WRKY transcription factor 50 n=1 Tax=Iris germanica TaxID=34205 RepID=A0A977QKV3_IRIGE|nr:WRKY transcription factor 50 [Iris germanica]